MKFPSRSSAVRILSFVALAVALVHVIADHPISPNAAYYWTVHNAIGNGLQNYIDIYEPKPPIIFFLSEWWSLVASIGVLSLPLFFGRRWLFGVLMVLYMLSTAKMGETEYFGAFFGTLFVLFPHLGLSTTFLFLSIGFKEPFFLALLGCAIVQKRTKHFFISAAIVAVFGVAALWITGMFEGYFDYYLPTMLGHRIQQGAPLWQRGFFVHNVIKNLWDVSLLMVPAIALLFVRPRGELLRMFVGLYLVVVAIGLGGDWQTHQYAMAVPFFTALYLKSRDIKMDQILTVLIALSIIIAPFSIPTRENLREKRESEAQVAEIAASVDAILDACDIDRYLYVERLNRWVHRTQHSPLNYFPYSHFEHLLRYHEQVKQRSTEHIVAAEIVILDGPYEPQTYYDVEEKFGNLIRTVFQQMFTQLPPPCAEGLSVPGRMVLFRRPGTTMELRPE